MVGAVIPKSPISALAGERLPGIGHNQGPPLEAGFSWRKHVWTKARKELLPKLPLEVIRRRVARAQELGVESKADDSPVTVADRGAEQLIRTQLATDFPDDGILGEEFEDVQSSSGF